VSVGETAASARPAGNGVRGPTGGAARPTGGAAGPTGGVRDRRGVPPQSSSPGIAQSVRPGGLFTAKTGEETVRGVSLV
jgi:hypothetical protein